MARNVHSLYNEGSEFLEYLIKNQAFLLDFEKFISAMTKRENRNTTFSR